MAAICLPPKVQRSKMLFPGQLLVPVGWRKWGGRCPTSLFVPLYFFFLLGSSKAVCQALLPAAIRSSVDLWIHFSHGLPGASTHIPRFEILLFVFLICFQCRPGAFLLFSLGFPLQISHSFISAVYLRSFLNINIVLHDSDHLVAILLSWKQLKQHICTKDFG